MRKTVVHNFYAAVVAALLCANMTLAAVPDEGAYPFICVDKGDNRSTVNNTRDDWSYTRDPRTSYGPVPEFNIAGLKPPTIRPTDRIGWSSDGTNDEDDWAATPVVWATLAKAKLQDQFVHFDYNNRLSDKSPQKERENRISTLGGALQFRFNNTEIYDGLDSVQLEACIQHLVEQINMSSEDSKFYYIQAGSFEVAYRALERAQPDKRKYCVLVSHSAMNEWEHKWQIRDLDPSKITNSVGDWSRGMVDCVNPVNPPDGRPAGLGASFYFTSKMGVEVNPSRPQFGNKNYTGGWPHVEWMKTSHPAYQWMHHRFEVAMEAKGCKGLDASDAGMGFAMVTGEYDYGVEGGFAALRDFLNDSLDLPAHPTPVVTRLELIDMNSNAVVREISNGDVIDPADLPAKVTIRAITDPVTIDSVTFKKGGTVLLKDEVGSMYTINEDGDGRIQPWDYEKGVYNLNITPQLGDITGATYSVKFTIGKHRRR